MQNSFKHSLGIYVMLDGIYVTHYRPVVCFDTSLKHQKTSNAVMFSGTKKTIFALNELSISLKYLHPHT